jgi:hypothetical protein
MSDIEEAVLSILRDFGGESSVFLITNADGPYAHLGDADTLLEVIKALHSQGIVAYDGDTVTVA